MNSTTWFIVAGVFQVIAIAVGIYANHLKNTESSASGKTNTAAILSKVGESTDTVLSSQKAGVEELKSHASDQAHAIQSHTTSELAKIASSLEQVAKSKEKELRNKYPYGYVLFGGEGGNSTWMPFEHGGFIVEADWKRASIKFDRVNKKAEVLIPKLSFWVGESKDKVSSYAIGGFDLRFELNYQLGVTSDRTFIKSPEVTPRIEVIDDSPGNPIWLIGFAVSEPDEKIHNHGPN